MTPPALVDTSILVDHLRGVRAASDLLTEAVAQQRELVGSVLTRIEVLAGMRTKEEAETRALLGVLRWVPVDVALADAAGVLARRYVRSHPGIDTVDYIIAATAAAEQAELWTRNVKHFPMVPGLRPPY
jgi:predicted nucleic acid-binding protein